MRVRASRFPEGSLLNVTFCITHACTLPPLLLSHVRVFGSKVDGPMGLVHADVDQNVTFSRPPSGEWLARRRMRSDGDDLGGKGRANSPH